jgi:hypothetical protein
MTVATGTRPAGVAGVVAPLQRRRSVPHLLLGAVLVVAAALGVSLVVSGLDTRSEVVAVARPVAAGQVLAVADLATARVAVDASVATVPAARRGELVGRVARVPLAQGALLSPRQVGSGAVDWPPAGQAVAAVPVAADRAPDGLVAGTRVQVLVIPQGGAASAPATGEQGQTAAVPAGVVQALATVVAVAESPDQLGGLAVSLLLSEQDAALLAATAGEVSLVLRSPGGGS